MRGVRAIEGGRESRAVSRRVAHRIIDEAYNRSTSDDRRVTAFGVFVISRSRDCTASSVESGWSRDGAMDAVAGSRLLAAYVDREFGRSGQSE